MNRGPYWKNTWNKKARLGGSARFINGHDSSVGGCPNSESDLKRIADYIISFFSELKGRPSVLEVGCGAGALAPYFTNKCDYIAIDYCEGMVKRHIAEFNNSVICSEANDIPFKDKYFDYSFSFSVFHYFPDVQYASKTIAEMKRVTKKRIFVGDLPISSHDDNHLLYKKNFFEGKTEDSFLNPNRFDVFYD